MTGLFGAGKEPTSPGSGSSGIVPSSLNWLPRRLRGLFTRLRVEPDRQLETDDVPPECDDAAECDRSFTFGTSNIPSAPGITRLCSLRRAMGRDCGEAPDRDVRESVLLTKVSG